MAFQPRPHDFCFSDINPGPTGFGINASEEVDFRYLRILAMEDQLQLGSWSGHSLAGPVRYFGCPKGGRITFCQEGRPCPRRISVCLGPLRRRLYPLLPFIPPSRTASNSKSERAAGPFLSIFSRACRERSRGHTYTFHIVKCVGVTPFLLGRHQATARFFSFSMMIFGSGFIGGTGSRCSLSRATCSFIPTFAL